MKHIKRSGVLIHINSKPPPVLALANARTTKVRKIVKNIYNAWRVPG